MTHEDRHMQSSVVVAQLNARIQPMHRVEFFEGPLEAWLGSKGRAEIIGGGTLQQLSGEIEHCDIEVEVSGDPRAFAEELKLVLEQLGAPKGSKLHIEATEESIEVGHAEGMAIYLNGTSLPDETYRTCDSNFVYEELDRLVAGVGRVLSYWQGPTETAFYIYGSSFTQMRSMVTSLLESYPLCHQCRVVQVS